MVRSKLYSPSDLKIPMTVKHRRPRSQTDKKVVKVLYDRVCMAFEKIWISPLHGDYHSPWTWASKKKYPNKLCKDCHEREKWQRLKQMRLGKQIPYRWKHTVNFFPRILSLVQVNFSTYQPIHLNIYLFKSKKIKRLNNISSYLTPETKCTLF